jgi:3-deoxy-manno-octulosonate cytidylyltransferase (CMP-KDO synthetase)
MSFSVVIPARYASTRLPGKPLLDIAGKPMLQHTWERALLSGASRVVIATDDARILEAANAFGAEVLMTSASHQSGSDRICEVVDALGVDDSECVINVQADEPLIPPEAIDQVAESLRLNADYGLATLCEPIEDEREYSEPSSVKVVMDKVGRALYFSRAPIPASVSLPTECYRHIGIYAYRVGVLRKFVTWPVAAIEAVERLEQLRALYNGVAIHVSIASTRIPPGVDTPEDLAAVRAFLK